MKNIISFLGALCALFCCLNAVAQKIHITNTSNHWLYKKTDIGHYADITTYREISYKDTTVTLNGHVYNQVEGYASFLIREEGNKIFIKGLRRNFSYNTYLTDTINEFLFFDYDLQVNDTLTLPVVGNKNAVELTSKLVILSIDSMLINNIWHKTFLINPVSSFDNNNYTFVEGIGSLRHGPVIINEYLSVIPQQYMPYLVCFQNNGVSPLGNYADCNHEVTAINQPELKRAFHFYPNPANKDITVQYTGATTTGYNISLVDLAGRTLLQTTFRSKTTLDISVFPSGMYMIQVANKSGIVFHDKIMVY